MALAAFVLHPHCQWNGAVRGGHGACNPAQLRAGMADLPACGKPYVSGKSAPVKAAALLAVMASTGSWDISFMPKAALHFAIPA